MGTLMGTLPGSDCVVPFDDVIDALQELDEKSDGGDSGGIEGSQPGHRDRHRGGDQEKGPTGSGIWY
jgi:hypothetical protein